MAQHKPAPPSSQLLRESLKSSMYNSVLVRTTTVVLIFPAERGDSHERNHHSISMFSDCIVLTIITKKYSHFLNVVVMYMLCFNGEQVSLGVA